MQSERADWFAREFGVPNPTSTDVLKHAKLDFTAHRFERAIKSLQLYVRRITVPGILIPP